MVRVEAAAQEERAAQAAAELGRRAPGLFSSSCTPSAVRGARRRGDARLRRRQRGSSLVSRTTLGPTRALRSGAPARRWDPRAVRRAPPPRSPPRGARSTGSFSTAARDGRSVWRPFAEHRCVRRTAGPGHATSRPGQACRRATGAHLRAHGADRGTDPSTSGSCRLIPLFPIPSAPALSAGARAPGGCPSRPPTPAPRGRTAAGDPRATGPSGSPARGRCGSPNPSS